MANRLQKSAEQLRFLASEIASLTRKNPARWLSIGFTAPFWAIASYRVERALFLALGRAYAPLRLLLSPLVFLLRPWIGPGEINYCAEIGCGLRVLHPSLGVIISGHTIAGKNLVLVGGNCIGGREKMKSGDLIIGDNVTMGANSVILGPVRVGNNIQIGAGAIVVSNTGDNEILVGVPARPLQKRMKDAFQISSV